MYQTKIITGLDEFRHHAKQWDGLWARSRTHVGFHRAQPLIHFVEAFAKPDDFAVVVAVDRDQWCAGIPLLLHRNRFGRQVGLSPSNEWCVQDCILDDSTSRPGRFEALESGVRKLGLSSVTFSWCVLNEPATEAVLADWRSRGRQVSIRPRFLGSRLKLFGDWLAYWSGLSRNRRKKMQKSLSDLGQQGAIEFVELGGTNSSDPEAALQAFQASLELEWSSWKGEQGTAILNHPQVAEYFRKNAKHFVESGLLRVFQLKLAGRVIAFDFGFVINGIYTSHKVSYLNEFSRFSPGQLLTLKLIEHLYQSGEAHTIDFLGPLNGASEPWSNQHYTVGKLTLSSGSLVSNLSVFAMGTLADLIRPSEIKFPAEAREQGLV